MVETLRLYTLVMVITKVSKMDLCYSMGFFQLISRFKANRSGSSVSIYQMLLDRIGGSLSPLFDECFGSEYILDGVLQSCWLIYSLCDQTSATAGKNFRFSWSGVTMGRLRTPQSAYNCTNMVFVAQEMPQNAKRIVAEKHWKRRRVRQDDAGDVVWNLWWFLEVLIALYRYQLRYSLGVFFSTI